MKFSKRLWRSGVLLAALLVAAAVLLRLGYNRFQRSVYPLRYSELVEENAKENGLEPALVYAVIRAESSFDPDARSRAGALGLMQMMPETFDWLQQQSGTRYAEQDLLRPEVNIRFGCRFLSMMMRKYGVRRTALCAYNAGSGAVDSWLGDPQISSDGKNLSHIPYPETANYVGAVEQNYDKYKKLYNL